MIYKKFLLIFYFLLLLISNSSFEYFFIFYCGIVVFTFLIINNLKKLSSNDILIIFLGILIIKFLFIFKLPILSDDIYRYLWEGKIFLKGFNPYIFAPDSKELINLRDKIFPFINHKNLPGIYPPVTLYFNAIVAKISYSIFFYKFLLFLIDLSIFGIIILILKELNLNLKNSLLYFINPLTIIEVEWNGHNDIIMVFFFLIALYFLIRKEENLSAIMYSFSVLSKFVYFIFIKVFLKRRIFLFIIISLILYLPFIKDFLHNFFSLKIYLNSWEFNGSIYKILKLFINNTQIVRLFLLGLFVIVWLIINFKVKNIVQRLLLIIVSFILCSPTVHPWYGLWILPFLCFEFYMEIYIFLLFLPFSYYILEKYFSLGIWQENNFFSFLIYSPLFFFIINLLIKFLEKKCYTNSKLK